MSETLRRQPETRDINAPAVTAFGLGLALFLIVAGMSLFAIYGKAPSPLSFGAHTGLMDQPGPVLQTDPRADRQAYDAEKDQKLNGLGWIDRQAGIAHVPIARAMLQIAAQGIPDWGQQSAQQTDDCKRLLNNVPRTPQAGACRAAAPEKSR